MSFDLTAISPADVLTVGGASIVISIITGAVFKALGWTDLPGLPNALKDRFGPLAAIAVGVVVVGGVAFVQGADLLSAVLVGLLAGYGSQAAHDTAGALGLPV